MRLSIDPPPPTPIEPVTDILHGVAVTDPFRWLEDSSSPRTRRWLEEQTAYTRSYFDGIPGRERIRRRTDELIATEMVSDPWKVGNRYFFLKRGARQDQPVIMMREGRDGENVILVEPTLRHGGSSASIKIVTISHDGRMLAYGVRNGGEDSLLVEFLDLDHRQVLPDRVPRGFLSGLILSSDGRGIYYALEPFAPY